MNGCTQQRARDAALQSREHAGQTGALLLQMPEGPRFALGSGLTDAQRVNPPPPGAQVTYRYRGLTPAGIPRFATLLRVREAE